MDNIKQINKLQKTLDDFKESLIVSNALTKAIISAFQLLVVLGPKGLPDSMLEDLPEEWKDEDGLPIKPLKEIAKNLDRFKVVLNMIDMHFTRLSDKFKDFSQDEISLVLENLDMNLTLDSEKAQPKIQSNILFDLLHKIHDILDDTDHEVSGEIINILSLMRETIVESLRAYGKEHNSTALKTLNEAEKSRDEWRKIYFHPDILYILREKDQEKVWNHTVKLWQSPEGRELLKRIFKNSQGQETIKKLELTVKYGFDAPTTQQKTAIQFPQIFRK